MAQNQLDQDFPWAVGFSWRFDRELSSEVMTRFTRYLNAPINHHARVRISPDRVYVYMLAGGDLSHPLWGIRYAENRIVWAWEMCSLPSIFPERQTLVLSTSVAKTVLTQNPLIRGLEPGMLELSELAESWSQLV